MYTLTEGAVEKIMRGINVEKPVLQILDYHNLSRPVVRDNTVIDRYRLVVSDGQKFNSFAMLTPQLSTLITDKHLTENAICRILDYHLSSVNKSDRNTKVMVILDIKVLVSGSEVGHKIGMPIRIDLNAATDTAATSTITSSSFPTNNAAEKSFSTPSDSCHISTIPIAALTPYQNRWVIKARVTTKSSIRTWNNSSGEGKLFSIDLIDDSGEIRCTAFRDQCDKFYDMIEPGNVYYISRCTLRAANKQFNMLKNDYEMTMTDTTKIIPCYENCDDIPTMQFNPRPISEIENTEKDALIDVLGVVTHFTDVQLLVQRTTGQEFLKRDVTIVDDSDTQVCLALWGKQAEDFDGSTTPIIAVRRARVGEFNGGKTLSLMTSSVIVKDPDFPEAHRLRAWYTTVGHSETVKSLSRAGGSGDFNVPLYTFKEAIEARVGETHTISDSFAVVAIVNKIRTENAIYKACPENGCRKKLRDTSIGIFRCDKCKKDSSTFTYRLLLSMNISDATGSRWITAFGETAERIIGKSAKDVGELKENAYDDYIQAFDEVLFERFLFTLRVTTNVYQDELRRKYVCTLVAPVTYKTYVAHLINKVSTIVQHHYPENMDID